MAVSLVNGRLHWIRLLQELGKLWILQVDLLLGLAQRPGLILRCYVLGIAPHGLSRSIGEMGSCLNSSLELQVVGLVGRVLERLYVDTQIFFVVPVQVLELGLASQALTVHFDGVFELKATI